MHINALKTQLMHKNVKRNPKKSQKIDTTLLLFYVDTRKFLKVIRGNIYRLVPKGGTFPIETIMLVVRSLYPNLPQMGQIFYHGMLMPLHDSMPSFMNFRRVLDLLIIKSNVSQCLRPSDDGRVFEIHSHFLHGT